MIKATDCDYLYAGYLICLRPISKTASGTFLQFVISSYAVRSQIEAKAKSTSGVNNVNAVELRALTIPVCSKEEQMMLAHEVESRFSVADHMLKDIEMRIKKAASLRQSILARMFKAQVGDHT